MYQEQYFPIDHTSITESTPLLTSFNKNWIFPFMKEGIIAGLLCWTAEWPVECNWPVKALVNNLLVLNDALSYAEQLFLQGWAT